jgi:hypothetical protein
MALLFLLPVAAAAQDAPPDFPRFTVPGQQKAMDALRDLYWLHYPGAGPKATLWDEWLPEPSLWPAVASGGEARAFRDQWAQALGGRILDADGYVATHQHGSIAHPLGWPFPFWNQGAGGMGWHFSFQNTVDANWRKADVDKPIGWTVDGAEDGGVGDAGWNLRLTGAGASVSTPAVAIDTFQAPFVQLRWQAHGLGDAQPWVEWITKGEPGFGPDRRVYFPPVETSVTHYEAIPMFRHPGWNGTITGLRIGFDNAGPGATAMIQALFTQYDTRQNAKHAAFVNGCAAYFQWTGDRNFLRDNINRMRRAVRYDMTEMQAATGGVINTAWVGHDGRPGFTVNADGGKTIHTGHGVGDNYWDLLPFGARDAYATIHYYRALLNMVEIERLVKEHPEWNVPGGPLALDPEMLARHAAFVKKTGNKVFWNDKTGRFVACVDADGRAHDFGYTFVNNEAIAYGFATADHARKIEEWLNGDRMVPGDTSTGADIYRFRFGPRATTKRNVEWYGWFWSGPETIPWGGQVQDGGAVLGFSYHDLMARLDVLGPDNAWKRLGEVVRWFDDVQAAGGYRAYYKDKPGITLQGGGTAGGLGLDHEFFESVLVPQIVLDGFLGFHATGDGFRLNPRLPKAWPSLSVDHIGWHGLMLTVTAKPDTIVIDKVGATDEPVWIVPPPGAWRMSLDGKAAAPARPRAADGAVRVDWHAAHSVTLQRVP